jgi:micrococcal nuclease
MSKYLIYLFLVLSLGACNFHITDTRTPEDAKATQTARTEGTDPFECLDIKGNLGSGGEKIYHMPDQPNYQSTEVDKVGEAYFCTEQEAIDAGFRRARN